MSHEHDATLPAGFEALQGFIGYWCLDSNDARRVARSSAEMDDIRAFYDAIVPLAPQAIECCEQHPLGRMPPDVERLFKLLLAMNHAAIAVEMHGQPRALDSEWPSRIRVSRGPQPHGGNLQGAIR